MTLNLGQLQHKVRQLENDTMAIYELLGSLDKKVDALDTKLSAKIDEVLELVRGGS